MRILFLLVSVTMTLEASESGTPKNPAFRPVRDDPRLPRVLLIGDSISIGYTVPVQKLLAGKANVHRIPENSQSTEEVLARLDRWLGEKPWDVIHFNVGLHDLKFVDGKKRQSLEEYGENLEKIVARLERTGSALIWASTTPVPEGTKIRIAGDARKYNKVAAAIMKRHGIRTNDLHALALEKQSEWQLPANVHFTKEGSVGLARKVAEAIEQALVPRDPAEP